MHKRVSKTIAEYELQTIPYISQHIAEIIPTNLILFASFDKNVVRVIIEAIIGNIENIFSYEKYAIKINTIIVQIINIILFFLESFFSKKYIIKINIRLIILQ